MTNVPTVQIKVATNANARTIVKSLTTNIRDRGGNLNPLNNWFTELPFIDIFKTSLPWFWQGPFTMITTNLDGNGWLTDLTPPAQVPVNSLASTSLLNNIASTYLRSQYVVIYDGEGTIDYKFAARKNPILSTPGRDIIDINSAHGSGMALQITRTDPNKTGNYIRNIRIVPVTSAKTYTNPYAQQPFNTSTAQIFSADFIKRITSFQTVRFMNWMATNNSNQANWSARPTLNQARWTTANGVPVEVMVALANQAYVNPWFNMPHMASDDYVRNFALYVKNNLAVGKKIYIEYSNEAWNSSFSQNQWIANRAKMAGLSDDRWFALRSAQVINIWKSVFGPGSNQIVGVLGAKATNLDTARTGIDYLKSTGDLSAIDAVAIAPYFGDYFADPQLTSQLEKLTLDDLFNELTRGGTLKNSQGVTLAPGGALQQSYNSMENYVNLTRQNNLQLLGYEGGPHPVFSRKGNSSIINTLFARANDDPRMEVIYREYISKWNQLGGGLLLNSDIGTLSKWGNNTATAEPEDILGTNLNFVNDWSTELPFIDSFKSSRPWVLEGSSTTLTTNLDGNGWLTSSTTIGGIATNSIVSTLLFRDMKNNYPSGPYLVLYDGEGTLNYRFAGSKNQALSRTGRDFIYIDSSNNSGLALQILRTDPNKTGNYLRNIRVIPAQYETNSTNLYNGQTFNPSTAQIFNPAFTDIINPFQAVRFMNWGRINDNPLVNWNDRPTLSDARWSSVKGVPVEVMVALANQGRFHPWFNIPHMATDDYVRNFAQYAKDNLAINKKIYLEYTNEAWNPQFSQNRWISNQAMAAGISPLQWYASRSAQVIDIWKNVFGTQADRIVGVLGAQAANTWTATTALNYLKSTGDAEAINAIAIAPYFGHYLGDPKLTSQVEKLSLDALFDELTKGGIIKNAQNGAFVLGGALQQAYGWMQNYVDFANRNNLKLIAYEGGQHLVGNGGAQNNDKVSNLFMAANRDPRMEQIYRDYLSKWYQSGGGLMMHYTSVRNPSKWGSFGAMDNLNDVNNPKYKALMEILQPK